MGRRVRWRWRFPCGREPRRRRSPRSVLRRRLGWRSSRKRLTTRWPRHSPALPRRGQRQPARWRSHLRLRHQLLLLHQRCHPPPPRRPSLHRLRHDRAPHRHHRCASHPRLRPHPSRGPVLSYPLAARLLQRLQLPLCRRHHRPRRHPRRRCAPRQVRRTPPLRQRPLPRAPRLRQLRRRQPCPLHRLLAWRAHPHLSIPRR